MTKKKTKLYFYHKTYLSLATWLCGTEYVVLDAAVLMPNDTGYAIVLSSLISNRVVLLKQSIYVQE